MIFANKKEPSELELRHDLVAAMHGIGELTLIESHELTQGIPDCFYAFSTGLNGWLELKAVAEPKLYRNLKPRYKFKLQASQHRWIQRHLGKVTIHLLVAHGSVCHLIEGEHHPAFANFMNEDELRDIAVATFLKSQMRQAIFDLLATG